MSFVAAFSLVHQEEGGAGVASDKRRQKVCAVNPGETLGTLHNIVGYNKTKKQKSLRVPVGHVPLIFPAAGPFHGQPVGSYNESARAEKWVSVCARERGTEEQREGDFKMVEIEGG